MKSTKSRKIVAKKSLIAQLATEPSAKQIAIGLAGAGLIAGVAYLLVKKFQSEKEVIPGEYNGDEKAKHEHDIAKRFGNGTRDKVDQQVWESFPASDPAGNY